MDKPQGKIICHRCKTVMDIDQPNWQEPGYENLPLCGVCPISPEELIKDYFDACSGECEKKEAPDGNSFDCMNCGGTGVDGGYPDFEGDRHSVTQSYCEPCKGSGKVRIALATAIEEGNGNKT